MLAVKRAAGLFMPIAYARQSVHSSLGAQYMSDRVVTVQTFVQVGAQRVHAGHPQADMQARHVRAVNNAGTPTEHLHALTVAATVVSRNAAGDSLLQNARKHPGCLAPPAGSSVGV